MTRCLFASIAVTMAVAAGPTMAQDAVLAHIDENGAVVIRQFLAQRMAIGAPGPKLVDSKEGPATKQLKHENVVREHVMRFKIEHVLASTIDGTRLPDDALKKALAKETPVLYTGWVFIKPDVPITKEEMERPGPKLPDLARKVYREDTISVFGLRVPYMQNPGKPGSAGAPQGAAPELVEASVTDDGKLLLQTRYEGNYKMPLLAKAKPGPGQPRPEMSITSINLNTRELPVRAAKLFLGDKQLPFKLENPTPVMLSSDGKNVDPFYLRLARPGTQVVVIPNMESLVAPAPNEKAPLPAPKKTASR